MESQWIMGSVVTFTDVKYRMLFSTLLIFCSRKNVIWNSCTFIEELKHFIFKAVWTVKQEMYLGYAGAFPRQQATRPRLAMANRLSWKTQMN